MTETSPLGSLDERELLQHVQARVPSVAGVVVGGGDDAAAVEIGPFALVASVSFVEGVHFGRDATPPRLLGRKALSADLSELAATGGLGRYATVSLCLPPQLELGWLDALYDGLLERAAEAGVGLVGGQVTCGGSAVVVTATMLGDAGLLLLRMGAQAGDRVVVTGTLGAAAEGARLLADGARLDEEGTLLTTGAWTASSSEAVHACLRAHLDPRPPLALARSIAERGFARAGMDISCGLSRDLVQICRQGDLGAVVDAGALPLDARAAQLSRARGGDPRALALHGAGDYQLLLAVAPAQLEAVVELARVWGVEVTAIGEFVAGEPCVTLRDESGARPLLPPERA